MFDVEPESATGGVVAHSLDELDLETAQAVQRILNQLAADQDNEAAREAAQVPYWKACPDSVRGCRAAARALRAAAESLAVPTLLA